MKILLCLLSNKFVLVTGKAILWIPSAYFHTHFICICWIATKEQAAAQEMVVVAVSSAGLSTCPPFAATPAIASSNLTKLCPSPDTEGPLPVQAPEHRRTDDECRGFHLCRPNAAVRCQRRLGHRDLAPDRLQGFSSRKLHRESQWVRHMG